MKTEPLTHGSFKAVREGSCNILYVCENDKTALAAALFQVYAIT